MAIPCGSVCFKRGEQWCNIYWWEESKITHITFNNGAVNTLWTMWDGFSKTETTMQYHNNTFKRIIFLTPLNQ